MLKQFIKGSQNFKKTQYFRNSTVFQFSEQQQQQVQSRGIERQTYDNVKEGDVIHNFTLKKIEDIPDFKFKAYHLEHNNTGTQFMHIDAPDLNNCMAIIFKTIPENDKGTPHILEHLACCGGEKYPVRDPFMKMLKRSLNTYMNAWTGPDFTAYPFSSQNQKDFNNLMSVYMDISLKSLLKKTDFLQEGWRYDFSEKDELQYKGVVFNEMKGVYQTADNILSNLVSKELYKNSIYSLSSGGNPPDITDLSYEETKEFYQKHYHPSNAKIFSYGDLDFTGHLSFLDQNYLQQTNRQEPTAPVTLSERFDQPKEDLVFYGPPDPMSIDPEAQVKFGYTYLCNDVISDPLETLGLQVLSHLLFQQPNGPLYKALIEKGLAPAFIATNGYEGYSKEGSFTIGVTGIKEDEISRVRDVIFDTLKNKVEFSEEIIESVLHIIELDSKVPKSNFGLNVLMQVLNNYNHGGQILSVLEVSNNIKALRQKILEENFLKELTEKYILNNQHYISYKMLPDEDYQAKQEQQELEKLQKIQSQLKESEIQEIKEINQQLKQEQDQEEDNVELLPTLNLEDIELKVEPVNIEQDNIDDNIPYYFTKQSTNGVTFLRMKIDLEEVPLYIRQYLDLFTTLMSQIGTQKYDKDQMNTLLNLYTSGFSVYSETANDKNDSNKVKSYLVFKISCIDRNIKKMMELFREILINPKFSDQEHIITIIKNNATLLGQNIVDSSMGYAQSVANASLREKYYINEKLTATQFMCNLGKNVQQCTKVTAKLYMEDLEFQFMSIMQFLMNRKRISFFVSSDNETNSRDLQRELLRFVDQATVQYTSFNGYENDPYFTEDNPNPFEQQYLKQYYTLPMQVNYVIQSLQIPHYNHEDYANVHLLSELLSNKVLHREIREKGGAYGGGCKVGDGVLNFYSYRDPNTVDTLSAYDLSIQKISSGEFDEQDIKEAKLSVFQKIDKVITPQNKGLAQFMYDLSREDRQLYRERLLAASKESLVGASQLYLQQAYQENKVSSIIFGADNQQQYQQLQEQGWEVKKALE